MAKRLIPSFNRILVEKIIPPSKTNSGILLPEKTPKLNSGKVVAVGPGARDRDGKHIPVNLKEGDTVLLPEYGGTEVKLGEKDKLRCFGCNAVIPLKGITYTEMMTSWEPFMTEFCGCGTGE
ncbi:hypothetical protein GOBAR_DD36487 [Gossypium barbadense]|nr:hypothetical protein GOBAR_DD36487 [Gossypium barbadense]